MTIQQAFERAVQHHQAGRLQEAEQIYRQILAQQPAHPGALHYLGVIAHQVGRHDMAVDLIRRALALVPNWPDACNNLSVALQAKGCLDEAIIACRQALAIQDDNADAYYHLGNALQAKGDLDEAIAAYRQAIRLKPNYFDAHYNLGNALRAKGLLDEAIAAYRQALALKPDIAQAWNNLGNTLQMTGQLDEAIVAYRQALALQPDYADAHNNLGNTLQAKGFLDEAIAAYRQALARKPDFIHACNNLGRTLEVMGQPDEAIAVCRQALALRPDDPDAYSNLGNALQAKGLLDEAIAAWRQALVLKPNFTEAHSSLVFFLSFHPGFDAPAIAREYRRWNQQHAEPLKHLIQPHTNDREAARRLRIGYVSPDFRVHCQSFFTVPLLSCHNHRDFEITCYAGVLRPDTLTARLQGYADTWRSTVGWTDQQLATQIRQDRIDILVDLTMHMAGNRLLVFARKPAPVQVCWLAYPGTTGLSTIDYRLSDPYLDPPDARGMDESVYSEQTIRLPGSFWCYDPLDGREIPVGPLPALEKGVVTFGCLNNFCKINEGVLAVWTQVLRKVKNSRLLLLAPEGDHRQRTLDRLSREGIDPARVEFVPRQSRQKYLELYHRIDLGLDSFPSNGHTTSLDSFWMGVPVVTLVGQTAVARAGWCQLSNLGLQELAGQTPEQFVQIAVDLASDLPRLTELRSSLRQRMQASPLMDAPKFARDIEAAYRQMWRKWCATTG